MKKYILTVLLMSSSLFAMQRITHTAATRATAHCPTCFIPTRTYKRVILRTQTSKTKLIAACTVGAALGYNSGFNHGYDSGYKTERNNKEQN